jgi:hypothetical protein
MSLKYVRDEQCFNYFLDKYPEYFFFGQIYLPWLQSTKSNDKEIFISLIIEFFVVLFKNFVITHNLPIVARNNFSKTYSHNKNFAAVKPHTINFPHHSL